MNVKDVKKKVSMYVIYLDYEHTSTNWVFSRGNVRINAVRQR